MRQTIAVVTGGGKGIGRAIALRLAQDGAHVAVFDVDAPSAQTAAEEIEGLGTRALAAQVDVTDLGQVRVAFRQVQAALGGVHVLVNNAGWVTPHQDFKDMDPAAWRRIVDVDLFGVFNCSLVALDHMVPQRYGRIISISSDSARVGTPGQAVYVSAKAGVMGFTRSLASEVAKLGITVNCVSPSAIATERLRQTVGDDGIARRAKQVPVGRLGRPEDIANAVSFLATEASEYITGQTLTVNGGRMHVY